MYSGYGNICKKDKHLPGSLLYAPMSTVYRTYTQEQIAPKLPSIFSNIDRNELARYTPLYHTEELDTMSKNNRFNPVPPLTSLAYRYDDVNVETPNSYPEFNSKCRGRFFPRYNTGQKKLGPQGCTSCKAPSQKDFAESTTEDNDEDDGQLFPILDPKFNLREVAKHMILLEDHLFQRGRRCNDCISKHRLTLEAFIEEAITLDKTGEFRPLCNKLLRDFKKIMKQFVEDARRSDDKDKVYCETAQKLRELRKPLCIAYSDFC